MMKFVILKIAARAFEKKDFKKLKIQRVISVFQKWYRCVVQLFSSCTGPKVILQLGPERTEGPQENAGPRTLFVENLTHY